VLRKHPYSSVTALIAVEILDLLTLSSRLLPLGGLEIPISAGITYLATHPPTVIFSPRLGKLLGIEPSVRFPPEGYNGPGYQTYGYFWYPPSVQDGVSSVLTYLRTGPMGDTLLDVLRGLFTPSFSGDVGPGGFTTMPVPPNYDVPAYGTDAPPGAEPGSGLDPVFDWSDPFSPRLRDPGDVPVQFPSIPGGGPSSAPTPGHFGPILHQPKKGPGQRGILEPPFGYVDSEPEPPSSAVGWGPPPDFWSEPPYQSSPSDPDMPSVPSWDQWMASDFAPYFAPPTPLVGVEPNPGPGRKAKGGKKTRGKRQKKKSPKSSGFAKSTMSGQPVRSSVAPSAFSAGRPALSFTNRPSTFLGVKSTIYTGRMFCQSIASTAGSAMNFTDTSGNQGIVAYLNPRIICQNNGYSTPSNCPLSRFTSAFRNFAFTALRFVYQPLAANVTDTSSFALAFDPQVIDTLSGGLTSTSLAQMECSTFGPTWAPMVLDCTPYLVKNRWYSAEIDGIDTTDWNDGESIQGSVICIGSATTASHTYGFLYAEFELHVSDMGLTTLAQQPSLADRVPVGIGLYRANNGRLASASSSAPGAPPPTGVSSPAGPASAGSVEYEMVSVPQTPPLQRSITSALQRGLGLR